MFAALTTPFDAYGRPSLPALDAIVEFGLDRGLKGLCLCGATGEYAAWSVEHRLELFRHVADRVTREGPNSSVPLVRSMPGK